MKTEKKPLTVEEVKNKTVDERIELAQDPNTPAEVLDYLAEDGDVRYHVGANPNTKPETLDRIARGDDWVSAGAVTKNPATAPETFVYLATHPCILVRDDCASSRYASEEALLILCQNEHEYTRGLAHDNLYFFRPRERARQTN